MSWIPIVGTILALRAAALKCFTHPFSATKTTLLALSQAVKNEIWQPSFAADKPSPIEEQVLETTWNITPI